MNATDGKVGVSLTETHTSPQFAVGEIVTASDGSEFVYVVAGGTIAQYDAVLLTDAFSAVAATTSAAAFGNLVAVAPVAIASGSYGFVQRKGTGTVKAAQDCAKDVQLAATATAGVVDDAVGGGTKNIVGLILSETITTAAPASCVINYPTVGTTN